MFEVYDVLKNCQAATAQVFPMAPGYFGAGIAIQHVADENAEFSLGLEPTGYEMARANLFAVHQFQGLIFPALVENEPGCQRIALLPMLRFFAGIILFRYSSTNEIREIVEITVGVVANVIDHPLLFGDAGRISGRQRSC